jgi:hypothetical protein
MSNGRKKWQCPSCPHRASRRGNMILHILRWHGGDKEPVYLGDHSEYLLKSKNANHWPPSSTYNTPSSESFQFPFQDSDSKKSSSLFEPINSVLRDFLEASQIPGKIAAVKNSYSGNMFQYPQFSTNLSSSHIAPKYYQKPFVPPFTQSLPIPIANTNSPSCNRPFETDSHGKKKEEFAGFRAKICEICGEVFVEAQYEADESGNESLVITKNEHSCLYPLKNLRADEMARQIANLAAKLTRLPWVLKRAVKEWTGQDAFLVAFRIPFEKIKTEDVVDIFVSPRDITNCGCNNNNHPDPDYGELSNGWALRVKENGSIILSDNDLVDFIIIARNKTSGYFRIHFDVLKVDKDKDKDIPSSNSEVYCMFINNRPLHGPVVQQQTLEKT